MLPAMKLATALMQRSRLPRMNYTQGCSAVKYSESEHELMSFVEHAQISAAYISRRTRSHIDHASGRNTQYDAPKHAPLTSTQKQPTGDQPSVALDSPHASPHNAPGNSDHTQPVTPSDMLQRPVGGDIDEDVEDVKDRKRDIVFVARKMEFRGEAIKPGIACCAVSVRVSTGQRSWEELVGLRTDIGPVDECEEPENEDPGEDMVVELSRDALVEDWVDFSPVGRNTLLQVGLFCAHRLLVAGPGVHLAAAV